VDQTQNKSKTTEAFISNLLRGGVKSIPLLGALVEQAMYGTYDELEAAKKTRQLNEALAGIRAAVEAQTLTMVEAVDQMAAIAELTGQAAAQVQELSDLMRGGGGTLSSALTTSIDRALEPHGQRLGDVADRFDELLSRLENRIDALKSENGVILKPTPAGLPPIWNVPHNRNPNFSGRVELLGNLRTALTSGRPAALTQAISGMGGVGKTQLAVEYAYSHVDGYQAILWLPSEEPAALAAAYADLARRLNLPEQDASDQNEAIEAVKDRLGRNGGWLLVFDNAPDAESIRDYLPQGAIGHLLITSRDPNWGGTADVLQVRQFQREESVDFLIEHTNETDRKLAGQLADLMGDLPLALEQARAYMTETGTSMAQYVELFQTRQAEMLGRGTDSQDYQHTVATTWELALEQLSPEAAALLNLCSFLAPDQIPQDVIVNGAELLPEPLSRAVADPLALGEAVAALHRYSLIETADAGWSVHRLVQAVVRERLSPEDSVAYTAAAVKTVNAAFPIDSDDVVTWTTCALLLPHGLAAVDHTEPLEAAQDAAGRLLNQIGLYLRGRADFLRAKSLLERAVSLGEASFGPDHPNVAIRLSNLGSVLRETGDLAGAKEHFQMALAIDEKAYSLDHPEVATDLNNLGRVLGDTGDLEGASEHLQRALAIYEAAYGPDHPTVAIGLNNLGNVLRETGDLEGASEHFQRALAIDEAAYGPDHPTVAIRLNNLGSVLQDTGDLAGAMEHFQRALSINEAAYGPDHPTVAIGLNNLGGVLQDTGDLAGAKEHYQRALDIFQHRLGERHPDRVAARNNLASLERIMS
jgi:tetratricopeptide (TPR) repeat protein